MEPTEHVDVLIVGAGISGIGAAYHLEQKCPDRSFTILEGRADLGGTWDLFRYPGIRSDSDMHTLGYSFKPWTAEQAIADGPSILQYLRDTVAENDIERHIRFNHLVTRAEWSSATATWTVEVTRADTGATEHHACNYLFMCSGYYSYKGGHAPEFPGRERFPGPVIHPQEWPDDLDYAGKKVVIIGSGATAMTMVPAMAADAAHVTMLQRSPTYVVSAPDVDRLAIRLRKLLPDGLAHRLTRRKNVVLGDFFFKLTRRYPARVKARLIKSVSDQLGRDYAEQHFTPTYNPWDQRVCLIPNGDLFEAIKTQKASVVTDHVDTFTETGIGLQSGQHLDADIIISATGLEIVTLGEAEFAIDGEPVDFSRTWTYLGVAYSDVPNLATSFGYLRASWTLRADLTCDFVCRLLNHMRATGTTVCTPRLRRSDRDMPARPWVEDFSANYLQRVMSALPRQGDREPWVNTQSYARDKKLLSRPVDDGVMQFTNPVARSVDHVGELDVSRS
ncbi:MAG: NAD(P)/FAD-dependent oxidoreductase [Acidimicrobiia bacterium]|nr:NAD(P)/FAD-dependent oxidoreductase [Acidimicrobiia bacterium]